MSSLQPPTAPLRTTHRGALARCGAILLAALAAFASPAPARAGEAQLAVAANFAATARDLAAAWSAQSDEHIRISSGSTGLLYAQIRHGAPFDALLAADRATPQRLIAEGLAEADSLFDYAQGRLLLWGPGQALAARGGELLQQDELPRLAIANPELAPYGAAARATLQRLGRWDALQGRLIVAENIGQAVQFVASGAVPYGLVPATVIPAGVAEAAATWPIPQDWHAPILQSAVLLKHGAKNPAARGFLRYLASPEAREAIRAAGYATP